MSRCHARVLAVGGPRNGKDNRVWNDRQGWSELQRYKLPSATNQQLPERVPKGTQLSISTWSKARSPESTQRSAIDGPETIYLYYLITTLFEESQQQMWKRIFFTEKICICNILLFANNLIKISINDLFINIKFFCTPWLIWQF